MLPGLVSAAIAAQKRSPFHASRGLRDVTRKCRLVNGEPRLGEAASPVIAALRSSPGPGTSQNPLVFGPVEALSGNHRQIQRRHGARLVFHHRRDRVHQARCGLDHAADCMVAMAVFQPVGSSSSSAGDDAVSIIRCTFVFSSRSTGFSGLKTPFS